MDFKGTGQLLPILPGWEIDCENGRGKILNVYHHTEESRDIPLALPGKEIGSLSVDRLGRQAKLIDLEWNEKENKIKEILQVHDMMAPVKDQFLNIFEVEYGERQSWVLKLFKYIQLVKVRYSFDFYKLCLKIYIWQNFHKKMHS